MIISDRPETYLPTEGLIMEASVRPCSSPEVFEGHNATLDETHGIYVLVTALEEIRPGTYKGRLAAEAARRPRDTIVMVLSGRRSTDIEAAVRFRGLFPESLELVEGLLRLLFKLEGTQPQNVPDYLEYLLERASR